MDKVMNDLLVNDFMYTVKSQDSQKLYMKYFDYFYQFSNKTPSELLSMNVKDIETLTIEYVKDMRDNKLSSSSIKGRISPILTFLQLNDVVVNKKKIVRYFGEEKKTVKDLAYTNGDIQKMLARSKLRTKVMILIYASTGIRKSAILDLKLKHLKKIPEFNLYKFTIYENSNDEYYTFCTPECASMIDQYIEHRRQAGEKITEESYLVRNDFDWTKNTAKNPKKLDDKSISATFRKMLIVTGLREDNEPRFKRHEKAMFHAFRKFFDTTLINANVNQMVKELLMGHSVGLDNSYYRPNEQTMLVEYSKAINDLTIDDAYKWKEKYEQNKIDNEVLQKHDKEMASLRQEMDLKLNKVIAAIQRNPKLSKIKPEVLKRKIK
jgi:Site-specific recombinase XerD